MRPAGRQTAAWTNLGSAAERGGDRGLRMCEGLGVGVIEDRLREMGIELPAPLDAPPGVRLPYESVRVHGDLAYISGHGPFDGDRQLFSGRVGAEVSVEQAYDAARAAGLSMLASLKQELGDLDHVKGLDQGSRLRQVRRGLQRHSGRNQRLQRSHPDAVGRRRTPRTLSDRCRRAAIGHASRSRSHRHTGLIQSGDYRFGRTSAVPVGGGVQDPGGSPVFGGVLNGWAVTSPLGAVAYWRRALL
jgi:enamine deaminase RidA (YjgF/YER057c/UK114 family)